MGYSGSDAVGDAHGKAAAHRVQTLHSGTDGRDAANRVDEWAPCTDSLDFCGRLVGTAIHAMYGTSLQALHMAILCAILMVVSAVDLSIRMIPNACLLLIAAAAAATMVLEASWELALSRIAGGLLGFGIFLIPLLLKSKAGAGDMKFIAVMGLYLGFRHAIVALGILSVLFLFGAAVILIGRKGNLKTAVPMGPYISAAFVAVATMQI